MRHKLSAVSQTRQRIMQSRILQIIHLNGVLHDSIKNKVTHINSGQQYEQHCDLEEGTAPGLKRISDQRQGKETQAAVQSQIFVPALAENLYILEHKDIFGNDDPVKGQQGYKKNQTLHSEYPDISVLNPQRADNLYREGHGSHTVAPAHTHNHKHPGPFLLV